MKVAGNGTHVKGELYEVDDKVLANLDILEDHPDFYVREEKEVKSLEQDLIVKTWVYFIKNFQNKLLESPTFESYSNNGPHGLKYVTRYLRTDRYNHKLEILAEIKN